MTEPASTSTYKFVISRVNCVDIESNCGRRYRLQQDGQTENHAERFSFTGDAMSCAIGVYRTSRLPNLEFTLSGFGTTKCSNLLRTSWEIDLEACSRKLPTPMFSSRFRDAAREIDIYVIRQNLWKIQLRTELDKAPWIGAMSLIFLSRWNSW